MSGTSGAGITKSNKVFSCVHCQQRKIKCDKKEPCSACIKAKTTCISRAPAPPKRRKRTSPDAAANKIPEMVQSMNSFTVQDAETSSVYNPSPPPYDDPKTSAILEKTGWHSPRLEPGRMIQGVGNTGYIGNKLWASITEQFDTPAEMFRGFRFDDKYAVHSDHHSNEIIFGLPSSKDVTNLHPSPVHIFRLWQIFLDNINPVTKILHAPTFQKLVMEACTDMSSMLQSVQLMLFSIYALSIVSISDVECLNIFGESRRTLLYRYQSGARQMFVDVMLLKRSNLMYLQAFTLYLLSIQSTEDVRALWVLSGIAVRLACRIGLHRDGAALGLTPFDVEMRRRLWWQIIILDIRCTELSGSSVSVIKQAWDTRMPLNVNDSDLTPEMTNPPEEYTRATEMVYCLVRYEQFDWIRRPLTNPELAKEYGKNAMVLVNPMVDPRLKEEVIKELFDIFKEKYTKTCDSTILLQAYTKMFVGVTSARGRLMAHNRAFRESAVKLPQDIRDSMFLENLDVISNYNSFRASDKFKNFLMFDHMQHLWLCITFVLVELRVRYVGEHVDRAWQILDELYRHQPELITDGALAINVCIGNLALKSWNCREREVGALYNQSIVAPTFITMLQIERQSFVYKPADQKFFRRPEHSQVEEPMEGIRADASVNPSYNWPSSNMGLVMDIDFNDWTNWDEIIEDLNMTGDGLRFSI